MCLAIAKPAGKSVPDVILRNAYFGNNDSIGIGYFDSAGTQRIHRYVEPNTTRFQRAMDIVGGLDGVDAIIHFRYSTHGENADHNCHPFPMTGDAMIAHNGIISGYSCPRNKWSDTRLYLDNILMPLCRKEGVATILKYLDDIACGDVSPGKLVALHRNGEFHFANEKAGVWKDGVWYSNSFSFPYESRLDSAMVPYRGSCDPYARGSVGYNDVKEWAIVEGFCPECGGTLDIEDNCYDCGLSWRFEPNRARYLWDDEAGEFVEVVC